MMGRHLSSIPRVRAFSLLEVMIAGALFLTSLTGIMSAYQTGLSVYEHQRRITQALSVGEFTLEELLLRYSSSDDIAINGTANEDRVVVAANPRLRCMTEDLATVPCATTTVDPDGTAHLAREDRVNYLLAWTVTTTVANLRHVRVQVIWNEQRGEKRILLETYRP